MGEGCTDQRAAHSSLWPPLICFILLLQCTAFSQNTDSLWSFLNTVEHYGLTSPQWLSPARHKRSQMNTKHPSEAEVKITAEGAELVLQLQRNDDAEVPAALSSI